MSKKDNEEYVTKLKGVVQDMEHNYYNGGESNVEDEVFDSSEQKLTDVLTENSYISNHALPDTVGGLPVTEQPNVGSKIPMLSLKDIFTVSELDAFIRQTKSAEYCCEVKFDGMALNLIYVNGVLIDAHTRGLSDSLTHKTSFIRGIPTTLKGDSIPPYLEVRGEVILPKDELSKVNERRVERGKSPFMNPRNGAAGILQNKHMVDIKYKPLMFYPYTIADITPAFRMATHTLEMATLNGLGFNISGLFAIADSLKGIVDFYKKINTVRESLDFDIDGIVIKVNSYAEQEVLGYRSTSPVWAVAYKFPPTLGVSRISNIVAQVGRTGQITPVGLIEPIALGGVSVCRATLHNADTLTRLDLHIGDSVVVKRAGDVIPAIESVIADLRPNGATPAHMPILCPSCNSVLERLPGEANTYCRNWKGCREQRVQSISHFASKAAMNIIGLSKKTVGLLMDVGLIDSRVDLYKISIDDLLEVDGFQYAKAAKLIAAIDASKSVTLSKFIYAIGIEDMGKDLSKQIAGAIGTLEAFKKISRIELLSFDSVGGVTASKIRKFWDDPEKSAEVNYLLKFIEIDEDKPASTTLVGDVVITGSFVEGSASDIKDSLEDMGLTVKGSVSKNTTAVLVGNKPGSKAVRANELGIPTYSTVKTLIEAIQINMRG